MATPTMIEKQRSAPRSRPCGRVYYLPVCESGKPIRPPWGRYTGGAGNAPRR